MISPFDFVFLGMTAIPFLVFLLIPGLPYSLAFSVIFGLLLGSWLVYRPSEWTIEGVKGLGKAMGASSYTTGTISSLAANLAEAVILTLILYRAFTQKITELIDISILLLLTTVGFNLLILGALIVVLAKKEPLKIPKEATHLETELYRFIFVALLMFFGFSITHTLFVGKGTYTIPRYTGIFFLLSYLLYIFLAEKPAKVKKVESDLKLKKAILLFLFGIGGIFIGGQILVYVTEASLTSALLAPLGDPLVIMALILGFLSAVPEHATAVLAGIRGDVDLGLGNILSGISQLILLVFGIILLLIPVPLDRYISFQMLITGLMFWWIKRTVLDDRKFDRFEGSILILLQLFGFGIMLAW